MDPQDLHNLSKFDLFKYGAKIATETLVTRGRNFIYVPRRYDSNPEYEKWKLEVEPITYTVSGNTYKAWLDTDPVDPPERVWLLFGGNGSVAIDWLPVTTFAPPSADAFVLFDYPGYGDNPGKPSRKGIQRCIDELILQLLTRFDLDAQQISSRFRVMGHSLGAAIALETAVRYEIPRAVLIAPFTSVRDMAAHLFWKPLGLLAADPYDNGKSLQKMPQDSEITIIHGQNDAIIPIDMARQLHQAHPEITKLIEHPEAGHNDILLMLSDQLGEILTSG